MESVCVLTQKIGSLHRKSQPCIICEYIHKPHQDMPISNITDTIAPVLFLSVSGLFSLYFSRDKDTGGLEVLLL